MPALRAILAVTMAVGSCVLAAGALAAPSAVPQPTPPPGGGGGGSSGSGGGSSSGGGTTTPRPVGPVAVANGKAGAALLEATGERTKEPVATSATPATTAPPPTTTDPPVTTAAAPVTTAQAPVTTAEIAPPPTTSAGEQPAAAASSGDDSGSSLPRDGLVVLAGVLLMGIAVSFRAIKARERRIGWALLGFCVVYLVALAGVVAGFAGGVT